MTEPDGESGKGAESEVVRTMVMLRVMEGGGGSEIGGLAAAEEAERELHLRSFPRPESGAGPASVSSQILSRKPMIMESSFLHLCFGTIL